MDHRSTPAEVKTPSPSTPSYFLLAVSTRHNLDLCIKHALAGFTNSLSGFWTYADIEAGDFVSFLYGAHVYNLYQVDHKVAFENADQLPPWPPLVLQPSGLTYHFPFRLILRPVRSLVESLVRPQFAYVAENLLLRGGYRKTHFQADQTTLQQVSELGVTASGAVESLEFDAQTFTPKVTLAKSGSNVPYVFPLRELIVQSLLRKHLTVAENLQRLLDSLGIMGLDAGSLEVLGEKAFPEGHVDLLIKEATPRGLSRKVIVEVKLSAGTSRDVGQLEAYRIQLGEECVGAFLVARAFGSRVREKAGEEGIGCVTYRFEGLGDAAVPFEALQAAFRVAATP